MKTHFIIGFLIGAAINLAFQCTDTPARIDLLELVTCATVAALAALTTALLQRPTLSRPQFSDETSFLENTSSGGLSKVNHSSSNPSIH